MVPQVQPDRLAPCGKNERRVEPNMSGAALPPAAGTCAALRNPEVNGSRHRSASRQRPAANGTSRASASARYLAASSPPSTWKAAHVTLAEQTGISALVL